MRLNLMIEPVSVVGLDLNDKSLFSEKHNIQLLFCEWTVVFLSAQPQD